MFGARRMQVLSSTASRGVRRRDGSRYATLTAMQRTALAEYNTRFGVLGSAWLARRWYYTPHTHRAYSVRQISPGDRRLLAEFALGLSRAAADREIIAVNDLTDLLFDRVIAAGTQNAVGFAALESTSAGDRVVGVSACAPTNREAADFTVAVAVSHREEQIGRTLLSTLLRHAKRVGVPQLAADMHWSNRAMQMLAMSLGFQVEPVTRDRNLRRLTLALK
jgi:RimJ/RimL family protein N-acetyltransferase